MNNSNNTNELQTTNVEDATDQIVKLREVNGSSFDKILQHAVSIGARDIYITSKDHIRVRVDNQRLVMTDRAFSHSEVSRLLESRIKTLDRVHKGRSTNPSYTLIPAADVNNGQNFRLSVTKFTISDEAYYNCAIRPLPLIPPSISDVGVTEEMAKFVGQLEKGLVLLIGATGTGKTSTIAAIMRYILEFIPHKRIIEFSRPVENIWTRINKHPTNQIVPHNIAEGQSGGDLISYEEAISTAMRQAADWIAVGEMTESESFEAAIEFSNTGHLVSSSMHASDVASAYVRIYLKFDDKKRDALIDSLISETELLIAQILVDRIGGGMVAVREVLMQTYSVKMALKEAVGNATNPLPALRAAISKCLWEQGSSFYQNAEKLYNANIISLEEFNKVEATFGKYG